ncbi:unnamed protein product, partial [marine sediment metagenome]
PTFPEPQAKLTDAPIILGLDGASKMSKSLGNEIELAASPEETRERVMGAFTDPERKYRNDPGHPDVCNVWRLHHHFNNDVVDVIARECRQAIRGCVECKDQLAEWINRDLAPFRERRAALAARPQYVEEVFADGALRAHAIAADTMREVKERMGLI